MSDGRISLNLSTPKELGGDSGAQLSIDVWDTGRGIPSEHQDNVFQEFFQLDNPERDRGKGLGLGLAIVRRLIALLGCGLSLRSMPGRGSVFKVLVPCAPPVDAAPVTDKASVPAAAAPASRRGTCHGAASAKAHGSGLDRDVQRLLRKLVPMA